MNEDGSQEILDSIPTLADGAPAPAPDTGTGSDPAAGEGAQSGEGQPKTALEAAERVMGQVKDAPPASAKPQDGKPPADGKAPDAKTAADAQLPFKDHPRWKEVTSENRILRVAKEKNETAIKELEPKAQTYDELSGWLKENQLGKDDFAQLLAIGSAVRNDPIEAYKLLQPIMEQLETLVGERLPQDLQQAVANGQITEDAAKQIAKSRGEASVYKGRAETLQRRDAETREQRDREQQERHAETIVQGVVAHVDSWAKRDPDAERKRPFVEEGIENELRRRDMNGTPPRNSEEAAEIVRAVVKSVDDRFRSLMPTPKPKVGILPQTGAPQTGTAMPKSSLEAAQLALSQGSA